MAMYPSVAGRIQTITGILPLAAVLALTACASRGTPPGRSSDAAATRSVGAAASSTSAVRQGQVIRAANTSGTRGSWALVESGIAVPDIDNRWRVLPYPQGLRSSSITDVQALPTGAVLIGVTDATGSTTVFIRQQNSPFWSRHVLTPHWTSGVSLDSGASVEFGSVPNGLLAAAVVKDLSRSSALANLFVSRDGGATWHDLTFPRVSPLNTPWSSVTFTSANDIVVVAGATSSSVYVSTDGGATWQKSTISGLPTGATETYVATPILGDKQLFLPVFSDNMAGAQVLTLIGGMRGGDIFGTIGIPPLVLDATYQAGGLAVGNAGNTFWVISANGKTVYKVAPGQASWTSVSTTGLPANATSLDVVNTLHARATVSLSTCKCGKSNCTQATGIFETKDGGRSWERISIS